MQTTHSTEPPPSGTARATPRCAPPHHRSNTQRLQQLLLDPATRLLLFQAGRPLLQPAHGPDMDPQGAPAAWQPVTVQPASRGLPHVLNQQETVFLGMDGHEAVFAAEVDDDTDIHGLVDALGLAEGSIVGNLR